MFILSPLSASLFVLTSDKSNTVYTLGICGSLCISTRVCCSGSLPEDKIIEFLLCLHCSRSSPYIRNDISLWSFDTNTFISVPRTFVVCNHSSNIFLQYCSSILITYSSDSQYKKSSTLQSLHGNSNMLLTRCLQLAHVFNFCSSILYPLHINIILTYQHWLSAVDPPIPYQL